MRSSRTKLESDTRRDWRVWAARSRAGEAIRQQVVPCWMMGGASQRQEKNLGNCFQGGLGYVGDISQAERLMLTRPCGVAQLLRAVATARMGTVGCGNSFDCEDK